MKKKKILLIVFLCCILFSINNLEANADERDIFIGDVIELRISTSDLTQEQIVEAFKAFEIIDLRQQQDDYLISFRSFKPVDTTIILGNQEIAVTVKSTLDVIEREDIFEGDMKTRLEESVIPWGIVLIISISIMIFSGALIIWSKRRNKNDAKDVYQIFMESVQPLDTSDDHALEHMTAKLKIYIQDKFHMTIIGKTSTELIPEIENLRIDKHILLELEKWLTSCDQMKFSGCYVESEHIDKMRKDLLNIVKSIESEDIKMNVDKANENKAEEVKL